MKANLMARARYSLYQLGMTAGQLANHKHRGSDLPLLDEVEKAMTSSNKALFLIA